MAGFDAVFVGSGINSLAGAALLAKDGWRVCVLERNDWLGGAIRTVDGLTAPGFTHEVFASWHPLWVGSAAYAELKTELDRLGLEYLNTDLPTGTAFPDGSSAFLSTRTSATRTSTGSSVTARPGSASSTVHGRRRPLVRRARDRALVAGRARARAQGATGARPARALEFTRHTCSSSAATGSTDDVRLASRRTDCSRRGCSTRASAPTRRCPGS